MSLPPSWRVLWHVPDGLIAYIPRVFSEAHCNDLFRSLADTLPWRTETDDHGKQDRSSYYCGDKDCDFGYVGLHLEAVPWPAELQRAAQTVNSVLAAPLSEAISGPASQTVTPAECSVTAW